MPPTALPIISCPLLTLRPDVKNQCLSVKYACAGKKGVLHYLEIQAETLPSFLMKTTRDIPLTGGLNWSVSTIVIVGTVERLTGQVQMNKKNKWVNHLEKFRLFPYWLSYNQLRNKEAQLLFNLFPTRMKICTHT